MELVCIGSGINKEGKPYSKLVPIVMTRDGSQYLSLKNPTYVEETYPLFKRFINNLQPYEIK